MEHPLKLCHFLGFPAWYYFLHLAATRPRPPSRHLRPRRRRPPPPSPRRPPRSAPSCRFQRVPHFRSEKICIDGDRSESHLGEVVHPGELEDGGHAVEEGADDEPVQGGGIVHLATQLLRRMLAIERDINPKNNYIF